LTPDHGTGRTVAVTTTKESTVSTSVLTLTESTFDEEITVSPVPVVVEFWAQWCPPCQMMAPMLDQLAGDFDTRLRVGKVDVDAHPTLAARYDVVSVPTFLVFTDGQLRRTMVGARSRTQLLDEVGVPVSP
jgi:thioredoxin 1